jgi:hypothetical protein
MKCILFNPLKPKLVYIIFKNSVRTSKGTPHFTVTKINWITMFKNIIAVYSENHTKLIIPNTVFLITNEGFEELITSET